MHNEEYGVTQLVENDNVGQDLQQHVTPISKPH